MCPILLEDTAGREMGRKTEGHQRMLSPAVSPEAHCSTAPIREGRGGHLNKASATALEAHLGPHMLH